MDALPYLAVFVLTASLAGWFFFARFGSPRHLDRIGPRALDDQLRKEREARR